MRLQVRVFVVLITLLVLLGSVTYIDSNFRLNRDYFTQETRLANINMTRVISAINNIQQSLVIYTTPWAVWDEAYAFMEKKDQKFIDSNFTSGTFISGKINFFMFYDNEGKFYYGKAFNLEKNTFEPISPELLAYFETNKDFILHKNVDTRHVGLLSVSNKLILMSSLPVVTGDGNGPVRGSVLMGYYFTPNKAARIGDLVKLTITPLAIPTNNKNPLYSVVETLKSNPYAVEITDAKNAEGYLYLKDINQKPVMLLQVSLPRTLYSAGVLATYYHFLTIFIMGIIVLGVIWFLLKKIIIDRIANINNQISKIYLDGSFDKRIKDHGKDELHELTNSINAMLELIDMTQDQLKYRVTRRTRELEKISELNRNLFTEIGHHKNAEAKLREEEKILKKMAYYDMLTGLPSRAFFFELLNNAIQNADRGEKIAILYIDVDHFKQINDTHGHEFGDLYLKAIAERLRDSLDKYDVAGRLAGDEMIMYLVNVDNKASMDASATKILSHLTQPITINTITFTPSFSIGISVYPDDGITIEDLLRKADVAMYHAKKSSGNMFKHFSELDPKTVRLP